MKKYILMIALLFAASAHAQKIGDWFITGSSDPLPDVRIAKTQNSTGQSTGILCRVSQNKCVAFLIFDSNCEDDAEYPMLINSGAGAWHITTKCENIGGLKVQVISNFDLAMAAFESGSVIGIAYPMASGEFRVVRFSTAGAVAVIKIARTTPQSNQPGRNLKSSERL